MKKIFIALEVPSADKQKIDDWRRHQLATLSNHTRTSNLHLTLCYLGQASPQLEQLMVEEISKLSLDQVTLTFNQINIFDKPRVLYLGTSTADNSLTTLAQQIKTLALTHGLSHQQAMFTPHITIVRKIRTMPALDQQPNIKIAFKNLVMYHSHSTDDGVRYLKLHSWPLKLA